MATTTTLTISDILAKFRQMSSSKREQGYLFEKFTREYLRHNPKYSDLSEIWLWSEFPYRKGQTDTGIDLVALTETGEYWAIQCKFYQEETQVSKANVDSFLAASSKTFLDEEGKKHQYAYRLLVVTSDLTPNATEELKEQVIGCGVLDKNEFDLSRIDWDKFWQGFNSEIVDKDAPRISISVLTDKKKLRDYQKKAIEDVEKGFETNDRGRLIMACGTGKTFTSLKMAERIVGKGGCVLYLVPSLSLMAQTLSAWTSDSDISISPLIVCSDAEVHKQDKRRIKALNDDIIEGTSLELARPATTDAKVLAKNNAEITTSPGASNRMRVVFSTYQSIEVIAKAQKKYGLPEFDLIVCDEAHRTTGVTLAEEDESAFTKVHNNDIIHGKKRIYLTATPRFYGDSAKSKAKEKDAVICSMDDVATYGPEFHRLGFGAAVEKGILSDYKVIVLTINEKYARQVADRSGSRLNPDVTTDDISKLVGCWNGLRKKSQYALPDGTLSDDFSFDPEPMKRAVMFASTIKNSKMLAEAFTELTQKASDGEKPKDRLNVDVIHVDGTMGANKRKYYLDWLKEDLDRGSCNVLSNVRCLGEGVDVPSLDAVIFLSPRKSQVEVVQAVGRVMRTAPGKKYGYVILPVVIPADKKPEDVLDDDKRFKVVWQVLNALRAHDERFNVWINQLNFKDSVPPATNPFLVGGVARGGSDKEDNGTETIETGRDTGSYTPQFDFDPESGKKIMARVVAKCGDRAYFENWAKEVAEIAKSRIEQIKEKLANPTPEQRKAFDEFVGQMQADINPSIDEAQAIEMLVQHLVMEPVFNALFTNNEFAKQNVISKAIAKVIDLFQPQDTEEQKSQLANFKQQIAFRVAGVQSAEGRQKAVADLYENFFKAAAKAASERLGIVYTPVEVVDYIIRSVDVLLRKHFNRRLSNKTVHVLDPFTGTGTFIVRLLQSGLIDKTDILRKCREELHANEIVLLAYYIAAINIEETMHGFFPDKEYEPFPGLLLTDTFQLDEKPIDAAASFIADDNDERNDQRIKRQRKQTIEVIVGNPPYSVGQRSANDNNQNLSYPILDKRVEETYVKASTAVLRNSLYDSYIKAFRWASDRIQNRGIVAFVTNGGWLDGNAMDGFRQCLEEEFSEVYVFDLRGNQRTSGERSRKEGGKIFGSGSRAPIAITLLVKKDKKQGEKAKIFYHDIGDYLSRDEKLQTIRSFGSVENTEWTDITPNEHHDWVKQRGEVFQSFYLIGDKKDKTGKLTVFKPYYSGGVSTNRDAWVYNFSYESLKENMERMIVFYNNEVKRYIKNKKQDIAPKDFVENTGNKISWTCGLLDHLKRGEHFNFDEAGNTRISLYRPYCTEQLYFSRVFNERTLRIPVLFPEKDTDNLLICIPGIGSGKEFSAIITNTIPCYDITEKSQCFPLYVYEANDKSSLFDDNAEPYSRQDGITDAFLEETQKKYGSATITKEEIFYYIYGIFHAPQYREDYADDLRVSLARIPLVKDYADFMKFSRIGRQLAELHLNYDSPAKLKAAIQRINALRGNSSKLSECPTTIIADQAPKGKEAADFYRVEKMRFAKKGKDVDKSRIIYNANIGITDIPEQVYEYIINGKSALDWIMERYAVTTDKASGITNDPNLWDEKNPKYIVELVQSVTTVSVLTMKLVAELPKLNF